MLARFPLFIVCTEMFSFVDAWILFSKHPSPITFCLREWKMNDDLAQQISQWPGPACLARPVCHSGSVISSDGRAGYYVISPHITPASGGCQGSVCLSKLDKHRTNIFIEENLNFCRKSIFFLWYYEIHLFEGISSKMNFVKTDM